MSWYQNPTWWLLFAVVVGLILYDVWILNFGKPAHWSISWTLHDLPPWQALILVVGLAVLLWHVTWGLGVEP